MNIHRELAGLYNALADKHMELADMLHIETDSATCLLQNWDPARKPEKVWFSNNRPPVTPSTATDLLICAVQNAVAMGIPLNDYRGWIKKDKGRHRNENNWSKVPGHDYELAIVGWGEVSVRMKKMFAGHHVTLKFKEA